MFAIFAAIAFLAALLEVEIGDVNLMLLGLFLLALHFVIDIPISVFRRDR